MPTLNRGNNFRLVALDEVLKIAFTISGFVSSYKRPLLCCGIGPLKWCVLPGNPKDFYKTDAKVKGLINGLHLG